MSIAENRAFKKRAARDLARKHRAEVRAMVVQLREQLRQARTRRREVLRSLPGKLRAHRLIARERHARLKHDLIAHMRAALAERRAAAKRTREHDLGEARAARDKVIAARMKLEAEEKYRADMRRIEADNRNARRAEKQIRRGRHHALSQSDDTVRGNIPSDLVPLWERVKGRIKGGDRKSRTEAFLQYAEEHPGEVYAVIESRTDELIAEMERQHGDMKRLARRPLRHHSREATAKALGVPF